MNSPPYDPDFELQAQQEALAAHYERRPNHIHRCPPDMPPCPVCQELNDQEDKEEFGNQ